MSLIPGQEDPLEGDMATHSSILAWIIPWKARVHGVSKELDITDHAQSVNNQPKHSVDQTQFYA